VVGRFGLSYICKPCGELRKNKKKKKKKKVKEEEELCIYLMFSAFSDSNGQKKKRAL
jgi:hypothetical protein